MRPIHLLLSGLLGCLLAGPALAQTDTILRSDGSEVRGRVLTISPLALTYVPVLAADTLRLAATDVFLVRYANGTREVLHPVAPPVAVPPDLTGGLLTGLSGPERFQRGQTDAATHYRDGDVFAGSMTATFFLGPFIGLVPTLAIADAPVQARHLHPPALVLLRDQDYGSGYQAQACRAKRHHAWAGYATGIALDFLLLGVIAASASR